jgi:Alpha amylase, catalytic domain
MSEPPWWQRAVIYEIYPRSFQDSDGDGAGDLAGILERLDYLSWLGVDAVWIAPIYPSPMADFGYDVVDYVGIDPLFGTMADFESPGGGAARARHPPDPRLRAEPHLGSAPLVQGSAGVAQQCRPRQGHQRRHHRGPRAAHQAQHRCPRPRPDVLVAAAACGGTMSLAALEALTAKVKVRCEVIERDRHLVAKVFSPNGVDIGRGLASVRWRTGGTRWTMSAPRPARPGAGYGGAPL